MSRTLSQIAKDLSTRPQAWFLLVSLTFLYLNLFVLPCTPIWIRGDQTIHLLNAMRMREGQVIYRDFFQFILPGTELVYLGLFKLFGLRALIPNLMLILLGLGMAWLGLVISRQVLRGWAAFLPSALFLTFAFANSLNATHHWYSALCVAATLAVVIEGRSPGRLVAAAVLCGLAGCFTQSRGLMAFLGLAVFLFWEYRRKGQSWRLLAKTEALLFGIFLTVVVFLNAYFVWKGGLERFLQCTIEFPLRYYATFTMGGDLKIYMTDLPPLRAWYHLPKFGVYVFIYGLIPLVYVLFLMRCRREAQARAHEPWDRLMLLNVMGLFQFASVASSPSFFRLSAVSLPALIVTVWFLKARGKFYETLLQVLWAAALVLAIAEPIRMQQRWRGYLDLPSGRTAILEKAWFEKLEWLARRTRPGEYFFEAQWADVYYGLLLRNAAKVPFVTTTDYTRPEQVQDVVEGLEKHRVRYVFWSVPMDIPYGNNPESDHLPPLRAYLRTHYRVVKTFPDAAQIWERNVDLTNPVTRNEQQATARNHH